MSEQSETPQAEPQIVGEGEQAAAGTQSLVAPEAEAPAEPEASVDSEVPTEPEAPVEPDAVLLASREIAREALAEITDPKTIGADEGHEAHEAHVLTLFFECRMPGYPGWRWAATLARVDEESPVNVLEVELLPGAGAVTAPEWVPWSVRLAQYREVQARQAADEAAAAEAAAAELSEEDDVDPDEDLLENDFSDFDDELDGVDIDLAGADDEDDEADGFDDIDEHDLNDHDDVDLEEE